MKKLKLRQLQLLNLKEEKASEEDSYIKKDVKKMDIYTEEELAEIDAELDDEDEADDDYSEYDSDSYYED